MGGGFLKRMFRLHVQLRGHLVAVVAFQIVIQRFVIEADAASDTGGMCGEDCGNRGHFPLSIQQAHACGPFIKVCNYLFIFSTDEII